MRFATDTYIETTYFRKVEADPGMTMLICYEKDLRLLHLQMREWVRQLEQVMDRLGIEKML